MQVIDGEQLLVLAIIRNLQMSHTYTMGRAQTDDTNVDFYWSRVYQYVSSYMRSNIRLD